MYVFGNKKMQVFFLLPILVLKFHFPLTKNIIKKFFDYPYDKGNSLKIPFSINGKKRKTFVRVA